VVAIAASLAAILFPVFADAIGAAKRTTCLSNLMQIGVAVSLYATDNDDHYPYAVNEIERLVPGLPLGRSKPSDDANAYPLITDVLAPYVRDRGPWICPMDACADGKRTRFRRKAIRFPIESDQASDGKRSGFAGSGLVV
jgi:type II secretory pathway pseudopilin PulG